MPRRRTSTPSHHDTCADFLDAVARSTRNRLSTADAFSHAVHCVHRTAPHFSPVAVSLHDGSALMVAVRSLATDAPQPYHDAMHSLLAASSGGALSPSALERAATVLRDEAKAVADIDAHTAHIRLSLNVLTWLPLAILGMSLLASRTARLALATSTGLFVMALSGILLNLVGRAWILRLRRLERVASRDELSSLMSFLVTALGAGFGIMESIDVHAHTTSSRSSFEVVRAASSGKTIRESLNVLVQHFGERARPLVDLIGASLIDGQPIGTTIERLARELTAERTRLRDAHIRSMPVRMAAPLVTTVLPAFVLMSAIPLAGYTSFVLDSTPIT